MNSVVWAVPGPESSVFSERVASSASTSSAPLAMPFTARLAADPDLVARRLTVVFDGAGARAVVQHAPLDGLAVGLAETLLVAAGV